jgi:hypothetical protein
LGLKNVQGIDLDRVAFVRPKATFDRLRNVGEEVTAEQKAGAQRSNTTTPQDFPGPRIGNQDASASEHEHLPHS